MPAGRTITVKDAILSLVTRSANDMATALAEHLGGTESAFAVKMTARARSLGMRNTTFRNASGLPDTAQVTTARDMSLLGRALQDRFPTYFRYFTTTSFTYNGAKIGNHNRLLGRVARRRRHQDRLHPRLRLQSRHLGQPARPPAGRRRPRRVERLVA